MTPISRSILILWFILLCQLTNAQNCLPEGITFSTQKEIDASSSIYPDCTTIEGYVIIKQSTNPSARKITNLKVLSQVTSTLESCCISENEELVSLNGLENLTYVGEGGLGIGIMTI